MALMPPLEIPPLGIWEREARTRFAALQRKLVPLWEHIRGFNESEQTIVVVPSQTIEFDCKGAEMQAYEERMLFMLLLLRQPRASSLALVVAASSRWELTVSTCRYPASATASRMRSRSPNERIV
jgi:hypothetical protein